MVRARGRDHDPDGAADGAALAVAARGARDARRLPLADARLLRLLHRRPGAADLDRRRRGADRRDVAAASGPGRRPDRDRAARAGARRRGDRPARRGRLRARDRALRRRRLPLARGCCSSLGTIVLAVLFFSRSARPLLVRSRAAARPRCGSSGRCARSTRASTPSATTAGCSPASSRSTFALQAVRVLAIWATAKAVGIDLSPRIYYVMGPLFFLVLLVPFTLNGFAVREAFFVSFLGSSASIRRRGVRGRLPLLPRHGRAGAARAARSCSGRGCAAGPTADACLTPAPSSSPTTRCRGSSSASRASAATRRSSSTTARRDGTVERRPRALPRGAGDRAGEPRASPPAGTRACAVASGRYFLILNADAWMTEGCARAARRVRRRASARRRSSAPRLLNPNGTLQRSVRGFPTLWRLATEYLFLRKLAPRSRLLNAFYAGGFDHDEAREVECRDGRLHARAARGGRRRSARSTRPSSSSARRRTGATASAQAGWKVLFYPGAECVHVGGASHGGRCSARTCAGTCASSPSTAASARPSGRGGCCAASLRLRGRRLPRRARRGCTATRPRWLASGGVPELARADDAACGSRSRPASCSLPGGVVARALGLRGASATLAWALAVALRRARGRRSRSAPRSTPDARRCCSRPASSALRFARRAPRAPSGSRAAGGCSARARCSACCSGTSRARSAATASSTSRACASSSAFDSLSLDAVDEFADGGLHPGYAFPLWHGFLALVARVAFLDPADVVLHEASVLAPLALLVAYEAGFALFRRVGPAVAVVCAQVGARPRSRRPRRRVHGARAAGDGVAAAARPGRARARVRLRRRGRRAALLASTAAARARRSPSSTRPTRSSSGCRSPASSSCARSSRGTRRGGSRSALAALVVPGGRVPRAGCCRSCATRPRTPPAGRAASARFAQYAGPARRLLGRRATGSRRRSSAAPARSRSPRSLLRAARRARAAAALGRLRARRLARGRRGDARAAALRPVLGPRLALAVAPRGRLLAVRVRVRRRPRRARRRSCARSSCRLALAAGIALQLAYPGDFDYALERRRAGARRPGSPSSAASPRSCWRPARGGRRSSGRAARRCVAAALFVLPVAVHAAWNWSPSDARAPEPAHAGPRRGAARGRAEGDVVFSDLETSYRIAAEAPVYVAAAPPSHVADTEENRPYERRRTNMRVLPHRRPRDPAPRRRALARRRPASASTCVPQLDARLPRRPLHALRAPVAQVQYHRRA